MMTEAVQQEVVTPTVRHLAVGASAVTLCGMDRTGLTTVHPSKARKTDCLECRKALRAEKVPDGERSDQPFKIGDYIEYQDGSAWEVLEKSKSSARVKCVIA